MPNAALLAPVPFLPLSEVPCYQVSAGEKQSGGWLNDVRGYALLVLLCLTLYGPGLASIPPVDRDESRFAQATRQMLETGDFIQIRFQHEARNKKPIGIHWLQAASVAVALFSAPGSTAIWPYRLPSALAATIAVLLTSVLGATLLSSRGAGFIAGILIASALGLVVEAHLAKTDAALLAAVVAGQLALGIMYVRARVGDGGRLLDRPGCRDPAERTGWRRLWLSLPWRRCRSPTATFVGSKYRGPIPGLVVTVLMATSWFVAIQRATGGRFLAESFSQDLLPKRVGAQESHGAPPGRTSCCRSRASGRARCFWFRLCSGVGDCGVLRRSGS
jgi:hypothetical protein